MIGFIGFTVSDFHFFQPRYFGASGFCCFCRGFPAGKLFFLLHLQPFFRTGFV
nr:MAG TPA: hypothetical protein [Caudoviricetes sp.]